MQNNKCVVVLSGGLDSSVVLAQQINRVGVPNVYPLSFNYGQRHNRELLAVEYQLNQYNIPQENRKTIHLTYFSSLITNSSLINHNIDVQSIKTTVGEAQPLEHVPFRNIQFLSIAAAHAENVGAREIYYGAAAVDTHSGHWDCSLDFLRLVNEIFALNRKHSIQLIAPLITLSKAEIIQLGASFAVDFSNTYTCYKGEEIACGKCSACSSRIKGFIDAKIIDPMKYRIYVDWSKYGCS